MPVFLVTTSESAVGNYVVTAADEKELTMMMEAPGGISKADEATVIQTDLQVYLVEVESITQVHP